MVKSEQERHKAPSRGRGTEAYYRPTTIGRLASMAVNYLVKQTGESGQNARSRGTKPRSCL